MRCAAKIGKKNVFFHKCNALAGRIGRLSYVHLARRSGRRGSGIKSRRGGGKSMRGGNKGKVQRNRLGEDKH